MAYKRISRSRKRELEEPDEFITVSSQIVKFVSENSKQIMIGVVAVVVLCILLAGMKYYSVQTEKAAQAMLEDRIDKYESLKKEATAKKLYLDLKPDFEALLDKYPNKDASKVGRLIYADICFNAEAYDVAVALYERSVKDFKGHLFYDHLVRKNLAYAYEEVKKYPEAIKEMEQLLQQSDIKMKDEVLFALGRLYAANDQKDKETEDFKKIIVEFPDSEYANVVKEKMAN